MLTAASLALVLVTYRLPVDQRLWPANASWTLAGLVASLGVGLAWRAAPREMRGPWSAMLVAALAWLAGMAVWDIYAATAFPVSPNPADLLWLAFAVAAAFAVHGLGRSVAGARLLHGLELAPLVAAGCALVVALLWEEIAASELPVAAIVTTLAYPTLYVAAALVMAQAAVRGAIDLRANPGLAVVLAGLFVEAVAFAFWAPQLLSASYVAGTHVIDLLWTAGMLLIGLGAWRAGPVTAVPDVVQVSRRRGGVLPSLTFVVVAAAELALTLDSQHAEVALDLGLATVGVTLIARAHVLRRQQAQLYERLRERERELQDANARLARESRIDPLTGVGNRLRLSEDLAELDVRARRYGQRYALLLCDLDHFKAYNDTRGHQAGDEVLRTVAEMLCQGSRQGDYVYRYGGEELLVVVPEQDVGAARATAERHRMTVELAAFPHVENGPTGVVTLSAGVAVCQPGESPDEVLRRADGALYAAKDAGRNRVVVDEAVPAHASV